MIIFLLYFRKERKNLQFLTVLNTKISFDFPLGDTGDKNIISKKNVNNRSLI